MRPEPPVPETGVLAVASHVVSGNVGNKIAVFVLQSMGCDVAALNTVQFSNHTGYRQWRGTRLAADEIDDLWQGLRQSHLDSFDMMLSGYVPGAAAVEAVGRVARDLRAGAASSSSFFWVLDPVMGDNGRLYVAEDVVPAYRGLIPHADLILPNQFEAELLSGVRITDSASLERAVEVLHDQYDVPHVVITSVSLPLSPSRVPTPSLPSLSRAGSPPSSSARPPQPSSSASASASAASAPVAAAATMAVVGSTRTSARRPRLFRIHFPVLDGYFSGTGDMFAALMVVRLREAVFTDHYHHKKHHSHSHHHHRDNDEHDDDNDGNGDDDDDVRNTRSWLSPDVVPPLDLPLARAAEKVLASMHEVLARTSAAMEPGLRAAVARVKAHRRADATGTAGEPEGGGEEQKRQQKQKQKQEQGQDQPEGAGEEQELDDATMHLLRSRAAELRLARNLGCLRDPEVEYRAEAF
ncbi:Ribokinase-like protein [Xylariaceae sp. FL0804]|nr:Ribokinase-like protein [Xylariaceae sp. FL0804]